MDITLEKIQQCLTDLQQSEDKQQPWLGEIVSSIRVEAIDPTRPSIEYRLDVQEWMLNHFGVVHGGCVATIVDNLVTFSSIADPRLWNSCNDFKELTKKFYSELGKLRNLSISYLRPIPRKTTIALVAEIQSNTSRATVVTFKLIDPITKTQYAVGTHDQAKVTFRKREAKL